jgi:DNA-binding transcriptional LysR family regulator
MKNIDGVEVFLLRCFAALMAQRSVSRAADVLATSQPAVSKALARLRKLFNDPLLLRAQGGMVPTERALELETPVGRILADLASVIEPPRGFDPANAEAVFRLSAPETAEHLIFPRLIARLQKAAPGVRIEGRHPSRDQALRWLENGEIDFRIGWLESPPQTLHSAQLYRDRLVCVARKGHPAINGHITREQFLDLPQARLQVAPQGLSARAVDEAAAKLGRKLRIGLLVQNYGTVIHTIAHTDLIATISERMLKSAGAHLQLQVLELPLRLPELRINMFWHPRTHKDPRHRWFRQQITAVAREL